MRKNIVLKTTLPEMLDRAQQLVMSASAQAIEGKLKHRKVAAELALWLDEKIEFGPGLAGRFAEAMSDVFVRALMGLIIEFAYQGLKDQGKP